jgi:hypothetical protein
VAWSSCQLGWDQLAQAARFVHSARRGVPHSVAGGACCPGAGAADLDAVEESKPDPRTLRAIARAWDWRRRLEREEAAMLSDIAQSEQVTLPFVSRTIRLAYLSPTVLERLLIHRCPCALPLDKLAAVALVPWTEQPGVVFED